MRFKDFPRRHLTLAGVVAVAIPLAILLVLQYSALSKLQETSPAAGRVSQENRLAEVSNEIDEVYVREARARLAVPRAAIVAGKDDDDISVFIGAPAVGVKRYFLASLKDKAHVKITIYDPVQGKMDPRSESPESWAIFSASVHSLNLMMEPAVVDPEGLEIDAKDPHNRIAIRPIVDSESRIIGAAGLVVDSPFFENTFLPTTAQRIVAKHFSESEMRELNLAVRDEGGSVRYLSCNSKCGDPDVAVPLGFVYSNWKLGLVAIGPSHAAVARQYFVINSTLSIAMTLLLFGAVLLSLRTASREIRLSEMKGDFVSNVSHELRTPIASIRVFGELLKMGKVEDPQRVRDYGSLIESESRRLTQLVNNILDFARIESGRKTYRFERIDAAALVEETVTAFEPQASQHGFRVALELAGRRPMMVLADGDALAQALLNLLDNAMKYSGDSRVITVSVADRGENVELSVTDHGIGIPAEEHERIFNRFHRVSSSLVHDIKGSGLGLSLVKHIIEAHGGTVEVRSRPGSGSTFSIRLGIDGAPERAPEPQPQNVPRFTT